QSYRGKIFTESTLDTLFGLTGDDTRSGNGNRILERGAVLHTDVAVLLPAGDPTGDTQHDKAVRVGDGEVTGIASAPAHWLYARCLMDAADSNPSHIATVTVWNDVYPDPSHASLVRLWYSATTAYQMSQRRLSDATTHLERGLMLFPDDEHLL